MKTTNKIEQMQTQLDNLVLLTAQATSYATLSKHKGDYFDRLSTKLTETVKLQKKAILRQFESEIY